MCWLLPVLGTADWECVILIWRLKEKVYRKRLYLLRHVERKWRG